MATQRASGAAGPSQDEANAKYRRLARTYDRVVAGGGALLRLGALRRGAVERLGLNPGDVVLDVACGTGLTFEFLEERIGPQGRLIGIDLSEEMLSKARERVSRHGWRNVTLIEAAVEEAELDAPADAAISVLSHDVARSPEGIDNVLRQLRPGATIVLAGTKLAPRWALPINFFVRRMLARYATTSEGFDRPWSHLAERLPDVRVKNAPHGGFYIAWGQVPKSSS